MALVNGLTNTTPTLTHEDAHTLRLAVLFHQCPLIGVICFLT